RLKTKRSRCFPYSTLFRSEFAAEAMRSTPGSSAGGEQPKFLARLLDGSGAERSVLVKFSAPMDQTPGRRWADLLACEWLALEILDRKSTRLNSSHVKNSYA